MNLIPWRQKKTEGGHDNPLTTLRSEMDRLLDSFGREPWGALEWPFSRREWGPVVDLQETDEEIVVRAEMPGMEPGQIDLSLVGRQLVIAGEKKQSQEKQEAGAYLSECTYGAFRRTLELPQDVDPDSVSAEYVNGVLTVHVKKSKATATKRIEIKGTEPA